MAALGRTDRARLLRDNEMKVLCPEDALTTRIHAIAHKDSYPQSRCVDRHLPAPRGQLWGEAIRAAMCSASGDRRGIVIEEAPSGLGKPGPARSIVPAPRSRDNRTEPGGFSPLPSSDGDRTAGPRTAPVRDDSFSRQLILQSSRTITTGTPIFGRTSDSLNTCKEFFSHSCERYPTAPRQAESTGSAPRWVSGRFGFSQLSLVARSSDCDRDVMSSCGERRTIRGRNECPGSGWCQRRGRHSGESGDADWPSTARVGRTTSEQGAFL